MRAYEGKMAVKHTATRRPPFQPTLDQRRYIKAVHKPLLLTLNGVPYKVEQNSLQQGYEASPHAPTIPVLYCEANVPLQSDPSNNCGEGSN
jgi:hypothetical protein